MLGIASTHDSSSSAGDDKGRKSSVIRGAMLVGTYSCTAFNANMHRWNVEGFAETLAVCND